MSEDKYVVEVVEQVERDRLRRFLAGHHNRVRPSSGAHCGSAVNRPASGRRWGPDLPSFSETGQLAPGVGRPNIARPAERRSLGGAPRPRQLQTPRPSKTFNGARLTEVRKPEPARQEAGPATELGPGRIV